MRKIALTYHAASDGRGWWVDSPQVPGWTCAGDTFDEVRDLAHEAVRDFLFEDETEPVVPEDVFIRVETIQSIGVSALLGASANFGAGVSFEIGGKTPKASQVKKKMFFGISPTAGVTALSM